MGEGFCRLVDFFPLVDFFFVVFRGRVLEAAALPLTLDLSSASVGQFSRYAPVERRVRRLVLLVETDRCQLQRVENVAQVELCDRGDGLAFITHGFARAGWVLLR